MDFIHIGPEERYNFKVLISILYVNGSLQINWIKNGYERSRCT